MLACLTAAALFWTERYEYTACETDGCVVINRWTGRIDFRPSDYQEEEIVPEGHVVSRGTAAPRAARNVAPAEPHGGSRARRET